MQAFFPEEEDCRAEGRTARMLQKTPAEPEPGGQQRTCGGGQQGGELLSNLVYGSSGGAPVRLVRYTYSVLENYSCDDFSKKLIAFELSPPLLC